MTSLNTRILRLACPAALSALVVLGAVSATHAPLRPTTDDGVGNRAPLTAASAPLGASREATRSDQPTVITIQLRDGVHAQLKNDRLAVPSGITTERGSARSKILADLKTTPAISTGNAKLDFATVADLQARTELAGLDDFYTVSVPAGQDADTALRALQADPNVETAYIAGVAANASLDFSGGQSYKSAAPLGIGQSAAANLPGGQGQNVHIFDVEQGWLLGHEDLQLPASTVIGGGSATGSKGAMSHGTAVLGELVARNNGFGVTGIVPKAGVSVVNADTAGIASAIAVAAASAKPGDVILIEQHYNKETAARRDMGFQSWVPVEYYKENWTAIRAAVDKGVIVVEAAGNGRYDPTTETVSANNLDQLLTFGDSGAIMVGAGQVAGCAPNGPDIARSRADFSNYGTAVNLQGWGECVTTLGYGDLTPGAADTAKYTATFNGTSSASPVVTGAAAILSSVIEGRTGKPATPAQVRDLLVKTGTAQNTSVAGHIGPLPNLAKAIAALPATGGQTEGNGDQGGNGGTDTTAPVVGGPLAAPGIGFSIAKSGIVPTTVWWSAKDASGIAAFAVMVSTDGGKWVDVTLKSATATNTTFDLVSGHSYRFAVAAKDKAGNWSEWRLGSKVKPSLDPDTDANLAYSGSWTRPTWSEALDGSVTKTRTAGDTVTIDFTARAIGWIASKGTTRGEAHVWLDGKDLGIVNLYSETTQARTIVFSRAVSAGEGHELIIQAIGPIDLDGLAFLT